MSNVKQIMKFLQLQSMIEEIDKTKKELDKTREEIDEIRKEFYCSSAYYTKNNDIYLKSKDFVYKLIKICKKYTICEYQVLDWYFGI